MGCFKQEGDRVTFEDASFEGTVVGNTLRFANKFEKTALAYRSGHFVMDQGGKSFTGSVNSSLNPDDNEYPVAGTFGQPSKTADNGDDKVVRQISFAGTWAAITKTATIRAFELPVE